jgi:uncharacterized coiled-coil protein SlyX
MTAEGELTGERLKRMIDLLQTRLGTLENNAAHRVDLLERRVLELEKSQADQEARLRILAETVVRLTTQGSLAAVGQSMLSLILAAIAAWIGSR